MSPAVRLLAGSRLRPVVLLAAGLTACATAGSWTKDGTPPDVTKQDLSICRQNIPPSIARDNAIESDIMATRGGDLQKLDILRQVKEGDEGRDRDITETLIDQCMMSKGYSRGTGK